MDSQDGRHSALATPQQRLIEERAITAFASDVVQQVVARVTANFRADRNAQYDDQDALIEQSAREHLFHACLMACSETPRSPRFVWSLCHDHQWMGLKVPGSRFGHDNSDNAYRLAYIDKALSYRIRGRFRDTPATDFTICIVPVQLGENIFANTLAYVSRKEFDVAQDGSFEILVDATTTGKRRNHLCSKGGKLLFVRDSMADWGSERPALLDIEPIGVTAHDDYDPDVAKRRAAELGETIATFFLEHLQHGLFERGPINSMSAPFSAGGQGGLTIQASSLGHYGLAEDEAMIITADPMGALYVGMQITDIWMPSHEYRSHLSSLNHMQAKRSADGLYRWVISGQDPGVYNWADGSGQRRGTILLRWQHIPGGRVPPPEKLHTEIVKLAELKGKLPADTVWVDGDGRAEQRAQRLRDYAHRLN